MAKKSRSGKFGLIKKIDRIQDFVNALEGLTNKQVLVGVPDSKAGRKEGEISNASLAYIHENGAPEAGIPARPFMGPGIASVKDKLAKELKTMGQRVLKARASSRLGEIDRGFARVGIIAVNSIRAKISEGIPPPLAPSTIAGRIRRVKGAKRRARLAAALAVGTPASRQAGVEGIFTPLIVTGQLRNAITYVIRKAPSKPLGRRG